MQAAFRISKDDLGKTLFLFDIKSKSDEVFASVYWEGQSGFNQCFLQTTRQDMQLQYDGYYFNQNFYNTSMNTPVLGQFLKMKPGIKYWFVTSGYDPSEASLRYTLNHYNAYFRLSNLNLTSYDTDETIAMDFRAGCLAGELNALSVVILAAVDNDFINPAAVDPDLRKDVLRSSNVEHSAK